MKIVAICGNAGTGKDTAANFLVKEYGYKSMSFADPIKDMLKEVFEFSDEQLWGASEHRNKPDHRFPDFWGQAFTNLSKWQTKNLQELFGEDVEEFGPAAKLLWEKFHWLQAHHPVLSPRIALQTIGTEWGRAVDKDLWTRILLRKICSANSPVVISDTRFVNELNALKDAGAFTIRIRRKESEEIAALTGISGHVSEMEINTIPDEDFSMVINNNKSLEKFQETINLIPILIKDKQHDQD